MKNNLFVLALSIFSLILASSSSTAFASIIFQDDFSDGLSDGWVVSRNVQWNNTTLKCKNGTEDAQWVVNQERLGIKILGPGCVTEIVPTLWNGSLSEYKISLDMDFVSGTDKNLAFRYESPDRWYDLKFDSFYNVVGYQQIPRSGDYFYENFPLPNGKRYHVDIEVKAGSVKTWIDGTLAITKLYDPVGEFSPEGKLALQASVGNDPGSEVYFDNIVVTSLDPPPTTSPSPSPSSSPSPTPTPSPSLSPTPTPTPVPSPTSYPSPSPSPSDFPLFYQTTQPWGSLDYDHARSWSTATAGFSISRWGCALTDAAMILRYYGIVTLPDGSQTNPGNLNTWLKNQQNGYVSEGSINWQMLALISNTASKQDNTLPKLEYRYRGFSQTVLTQQLGMPTPQPVILRQDTPQGSHFITAYRQTSPSEILIADPFYDTRTTLASYNNTASSMRVFTPSHTDLSYLMWYGSKTVAPSLEKKEGATYVPVSDALVFTEEPITDPATGTTAGYGAMSALEYPKPPPGQYRLRLLSSTPGVQEYTVLVYDKEANETAKKGKIILGSTPAYLDVMIPATGTATITRTMRFDELRGQIRSTVKAGGTLHRYQGKDLLELLDVAEGLYTRRKQLSKSTFDLYLLILQLRRLVFAPGYYSPLWEDSLLARKQLFQ